MICIGVFIDSLNSNCIMLKWRKLFTILQAFLQGQRAIFQLKFILVSIVIRSVSCYLLTKGNNYSIQVNQLSLYKTERRIVDWKSMNFLKNLTKNEIFEKVAEIANVQIKQKIKSKLQSTKQFVSSNTPPIVQQSVQGQKPAQSHSYEPSYDQAQEFILLLSENRNQISKQAIETRTKKNMFSQLQIDPIYLQQCTISQLFKMQLEFTHNGGYQRTQVLHQYLNQVHQTIRKVLFSSSGDDLQILQVFQIVQSNLSRIQGMLAKLNQLRSSISKNKQLQSKSHKIQSIMRRKMVIKQKLGLLSRMKQKQQITLLQPQNLEQVYYSERNRHKLYNKIKNTAINNSYFNMLQNQLISISVKNTKIISKCLDNWINYKEQMKEKNIQKLFICLYFVKTQPIYKDNGIDVSFNEINKERFIEKIQLVKQWKHYQYIRDPAMKGKIIHFLDLLITQINSLKDK